HKYKSKEAGKDGSDSKAMVVVDGSIDWDMQTDEGNTEPRSLENFGMIAGIKIESDADSEGEVVSANDAIPTGVSVSTGNVVAAVVSPQSKTEFSLMGLSTEAKWNNNGKNLYKLIDSSMSVRTKRGLGLDKYIREGELGIDDSKVSIFHTNSDELEGQPIYNRFALVDHMKAVPPPLTGNYMPPSSIPDIDKSQLVYGKKATDSSKIKTNDDNISHSNDSVLFDFSDRSSEPSTNDFQSCDSSMEYSRPNHSDHDSTDSISSVSSPASKSRDTIVIHYDRQEDFPSVCSIETDVKSSKTLCNKFRSFNKESHYRKHKSITSKSCYVCGSYLHLKKDYDLHEQRFTKRNAKRKGILGRRPTGKPVNPNRPKPVSASQQNLVSAGLPNPVSAEQQNTVSAGQPNPVSAGQPNPVSAGLPNPVSAEQQNTVSAGQPNPVSAGQPNPISAGEATLACNSIPLSVSAGDGILGPRPLNIQPKSTYFHYFIHNNQQIIFPITYNSLYSPYMTGGLNGKIVVKPLAGWPWTKYDMSKTKGSKINGGSKSKSWSYVKGPLGRPKLEKAKDRGIVDSGCSRSMSGNKDKLEDFEDFDGGEICDQTHRVLFTENKCLVFSKDIPLPDPSMVILSIPRKHNLYTFSLNELAPKGPLTCLIAKASQNESTLWHKRLGHVNFKNMNKLNFVGLRGFDGTIAMSELHNKMELLKEKNRTLIEAARTMLADSLLPTGQKNKRDARGIVCRNKARLVAQGHRQEEGIDYTDVFALVARIEAIRLFLAFASFIGFRVYQIDVKSAFLYGKIAEEVYVTQPRGFEDPDHPKKVYKIVKALYGLHQAPRASYERISTFLLKHKYRRGLQVDQRPDGIFIHQEKYVADILKKFDLDNSKLASTPFEPQKIKEKNVLDEPISVHLYRSMIGCLMYLTATRPDIMFAVCATARHQVTPKTSNLLSVKWIFKYLTAYPKLGLWYLRDSPFNLEAFFDSDYAGANGYRKSTTGGCLFLRRRLISWQCKKKTIVATSSCEAEYAVFTSTYSFGSAPTSGVVSTDPIPDIPSSSRPSELVLETTTSPFRDDDTGVAEEPLTLTSLLALFPTCLQIIATLEAELKATKILQKDTVVLFAKRIKKLKSKLKTKKRKLVLTKARASMIIYKHLKKQQSSSGLDFTDADIPAGELDSAGGLYSAGGLDSAGGFTSAGISVTAGPTVPVEPLSPLKDPSKGKAVATPSLPVTTPTDKELADQQAAILEAKRQELLVVALNLTNEEWIGLVDQVRANPTLSAELLGADVSEDTFFVRMVELMNRRRKAIVEMKAKAKREKPMTPAQQSGETLESLESKTLKSSHSTTQPAELHETTFVFAGATIAASDPIPAVTSVSASFFVSAAFSIHGATPIAAGVSTTAGASGSASEASVPIIELLDSPLKVTSLPLDPETKEHDAPLKKYSRKKSIARKRTLHSPSKPKSDALPFDEDDHEATFKRYLRQASDDDKPAEPVSLALVSDITTWEIIPIEFGRGKIYVITKADGTVKRFSSLRELMYRADRANLMVLYGLVLDKYKTERTIGIGLGLWMDLRTLIIAKEEKDASIIWDDQDQWQIRSWRFYALLAIHVLETEAGDIMYMFVDKKYPLTPETLQRMLNHGLEIDRDPSGDDLTTAI
nr:ribonuclease H-like domain, reverse transcriptase, RNA-dependent DNA polymerase [Tanacetum cinerariifolium]